jgi:hypothetical protein
MQEFNDMLALYVLLIGLSIIFSGCAMNKPYGTAANLPDSEVAILKEVSSKGIIFNERHFFLNYIDSVSIYAEKSDPGFSFKGKKILPGSHAIGVTVLWGDFCVPTIPSACFNACYSGLVLQAEAGRTYL